MGRAFAKALIIGTALGALSACTALRLTYNNGQQVVWWWLDGYVDFSREHTPVAKQAIDRFFEWHRPTQLSGYAAFLATAQPAVLEPTTPAAVCRLNDVVREKLEPAFERALVHAAELVPGLGEAQYKYLETRFAKSNDEMRKDFLQPDPADRLRKSFDRALERAEQLYGRLDEGQKKIISAGVAASPFDPQAWAAERVRRQREVLQTLRRLNADKAAADARLAALKKLSDHMEQSPDPAYRAYQLKLSDYNCGFAAQIHNTTTATQRKKARDNLKGWEEDLRSLMLGPPPAAPTGQ
jgi:hypothetical protein